MNGGLLDNAGSPRDLIMDYYMHILLYLCLVFLYTASGQSWIKRCFTCRSRGELGDCKDPFVHNSTSVEGIRGIEIPPCASGWCAKIVEGSKADYAVATERMCLQRPPRDEQQRCAPTLFLGRRVLMCFCRGDLCNGSSFLSATFPTLFLVVSSALLLYNKGL